MKRILVTGVTGLLGLNIAFRAKDQFDVVGVNGSRAYSGLPCESMVYDLANQSSDVLLDKLKPDAIIHCAAMANIDQCEKNPDKALQINGITPGRLASAARKRGIYMIHISTDAVFDGVDCGKNGYKETDPTNPINLYAKTKLTGEEQVLSSNPDALVARVNFFGWSIAQKRSLAEIFYHNLADGKKMMGFTDVKFCPLCVTNLIDKLFESLEKNLFGLYHFYSSEYQSKYAFGVSIARKFGFDEKLITPISWRDAGLNAVRSPNLIMNTDKLSAALGSKMPDQETCMNEFYRTFQNGLAEKIAIIGKNNAQ